MPFVSIINHHPQRRATPHTLCVCASAVIMGGPWEGRMGESRGGKDCSHIVTVKGYGALAVVLPHRPPGSG